MRLHFFVKNNPISGGPDNPTSSDYYLTKYRTAKDCSSLNHHVQWLKVHIPMNCQGIPVGDAKGTFEEKVKTGFVTTTIIEDTIIVIQYLVLSP
jgi:hypothetical protein